MVGVSGLTSHELYEVDHRKPGIYVIPIQSILGKLPALGLIHTICATSFQAHPATAIRVLAETGDGCRKIVIIVIIAAGYDEVSQLVGLGIVP
jgi:hypothetical protein